MTYMQSKVEIYVNAIKLIVRKSQLPREDKNAEIAKSSVRTVGMLLRTPDGARHFRGKIVFQLLVDERR